MESTEAYAVCDVGHWRHVPSDGCGCSAVLSQCLCPDIPAGGFLPARWCCWWEVNVRLFKIAPQKEPRFPHNVSIRSLLDFYLHFIKIKFKPSLTSCISVTGSRQRTQNTQSGSFCWLTAPDNQDLSPAQA